jgi:putative endonuclease
MKSWLRGLLGRKGENRAAAFLKKKGLRIVGRGVANRCGEIDLIALDGETIVFVEVRTRQSLDAGHPAESVTVEKQARVTRAALSYLKRKKLWNRRTRFDVVAIVWPEVSAGTANRALSERVRGRRTGIDARLSGA